MAEIRLPFGLNDVVRAGRRLGGISPEDYVRSQEFRDLMTSGFKQQIAGEEPTDLMKIEGELMRRGWGPKTSQAYVSGVTDRLKTAHTYRTVAEVNKENAPRTQFAEPETLQLNPIQQPASPINRQTFGLGASGLEQSAKDLAPSFGPITGSTPRRNLRQDQAMNIMPEEAWKNPYQVGSFMEVPQRQAHLEAQRENQAAQAQRNIEQAGRDKTLRRLEELKEETIRGLSSEPGPAGEPSQRAIALSPTGLVQYLPQREKTEDPLLEERRKLLESQTAESGARAGYYRGREGNRGNASTLTPAAIATRLNGIGRALQDPLLEDEDREELIAEAKALRQELLGRTRGGAATSQPGGPRPAMNALPDPKKNKGRIVRDTQTNDRFQSDGKSWVKLSAGAPAGREY